MKRKVIFIGGTSYSGSTLLDMTLANDPDGISLGEISALYYPYRYHHLLKRKSLIKTNLQWANLLAKPVTQFYPELIKAFPDKLFFVDSSKNPLWIKKNSDVLSNLNYEVKHILIYKDPFEIATSFYKRKRGQEWEKSWLNYYKLYFSLIDDFLTVSYKDLVTHEMLLSDICSKMDIPYFLEKSNFWESNHQTFFGNNRTKFHIYELNSNENKGLINKNKSDFFDSDEYRKIYYAKIEDDKIINNVQRRIRINQSLSSIQKTLNKRNINNTSTSIINNDIISNNIKFSKAQIKIRKIKSSFIKIIYFIWEKLL